MSPVLELTPVSSNVSVHCSAFVAAWGLGISVRHGSSQMILESIFPPYTLFITLSYVVSELGPSSMKTSARPGACRNG